WHRLDHHPLRRRHLPGKSAGDRDAEETLKTFRDPGSGIRDAHSDSLLISSSSAGGNGSDESSSRDTHRISWPSAATGLPVSRHSKKCSSTTRSGYECVIEKTSQPTATPVL